MSQADNKPVTTTGLEPSRQRSASIEIQPRNQGFLGRGASATVVLAVDRDLGREVAYKELNAELGSQQPMREYFTNEAQITAQLDHPNIVPIYEFGRGPTTDDGTPDALYLTMKRIRGRTFQEMIDERAPGPFDEHELFSFLQVFLKVCDAIGFAHSRGVIHRDIKPENIMIGDFGEVYVVDWGIAMLMSDDENALSKTSIVGSPAYMSPEQALGLHEKVDARTDIYCIGACLYEMLTQKVPHWTKDGTAEGALEKARQGDLVSPQDAVPHGLPNQLCRLTVKAMAKDPTERYQTAGDLKKDIEKFLGTYSFFPKITFEGGKTIINEGDEGDAAFIIIAGNCEVFKTVDGEEVHIREICSGDVFGEVAIFANQRRSASVRTLSPVTAVRVARDQITQDGEYGYWISLFTKALAERFLEKERQIETLEGRLKRMTRQKTSLPPR